MLVAISGLGISGFTLMHMSGNLLLLVGRQEYNKYSHALITNPLIYVAEVGLVAIFLLHISLAIQLYFQNRCSKKQRNLASAHEKGTTFAAKSMIFSGLLMLVFLILHLITFKYGPHYVMEQNGEQYRDLYRLVLEKFSEPGYVAWYVFCLLVLGVHLSHGISGAFQSLGLLSSRQKTIRKIAYGFAILVTGGFLVQPLCLYFRGH
jgi:succinate dehydrogenase / fumarate reductase cytochrome b subunit